MTDLDRQFLKEALQLAATGRALASPNPLVGAVVLDAEGKIRGVWRQYQAGSEVEMKKLVAELLETIERDAMEPETVELIEGRQSDSN